MGRHTVDGDGALKLDHPDGALIWVRIRYVTEYRDDEGGPLRVEVRQDDWRPCLVFQRCVYQPGQTEPLQAKRAAAVGELVELPERAREFYANKMLREKGSG
ncbi:MAG: hypothetical protein CL819_09065 [Croceicoccus sp.]|nr:hypothetical protein [Croceicoccus sp.]